MLKRNEFRAPHPGCNLDVGLKPKATTLLRRRLVTGRPLRSKRLIDVLFPPGLLSQSFLLPFFRLFDFQWTDVFRLLPPELFPVAIR